VPGSFTVPVGAKQSSALILIGGLQQVWPPGKSHFN